MNRKVKSTVMDGVKSKRRGLVKNIVIDGPKVGKFGKSGKEHNLKSVVTGGVKSGTFGKLENYENDDETMSQSEERGCKSIIRGLVKRNHEKHTMLADVGEEQEQHASMTSRARSCRGMQCVKHGNLELKYLRDLGVYEKADEKEAVEKHGITSVDTKCKSDHECVRENSKVMIGQICAQGLLHWRR